MFHKDLLVNINIDAAAVYQTAQCLPIAEFIKRQRYVIPSQRYVIPSQRYVILEPTLCHSERSEESLWRRG
jgi:hypothetical protein